MLETDVLIVGGGPTGVTLALELAAQKIPFHIVDKEPQRSDKSRALVVQPRSLELLSRHGPVQKLIEQGNQGIGATICVNGREIADIDIGNTNVANTVYQLPLMVSQAETEQFLDECLAKYGFAVERPVSVKDIAQDTNGVTATLTKGDGSEETIRAKFVVGCDGSHSVVRHSSKNFVFQGAAYPQEFILCDASVRWQNPENRLMLCMGQGLMAIFPLHPGKIRVVCSRADVKDSEADPKLEDFAGFFDKNCPGGGELYDPVWITRFHLHHRGVNNYRDGRLLLAGDAAHIHSPAGGQGMNTGMQDSINLGWKLALVLRGKKPDSFLDSYNAERHPIGRALLDGTDRMFTFGSSKNPIFIFFRNLLMPWLMPWLISSPKRRADAFRFVSEFGVNYRGSPIVKGAPGFKGPTAAGDRAEDGDIRGPDGKTRLHQLLDVGVHQLFFFSGTDSDATIEGQLQRAVTQFKESKNSDGASVGLIFGPQVTNQSGYIDVDGGLHSSYGFTTQPGYAYIRPDGYIAHIGPLSAFSDFIDWLGSY